MVRTRIAPSPTGYPHIGTIYQAMFDFAFAKKFDGKFIIRIEDTDRNRFVEEAEKVIFDCLDWFKLESDEDPLKGGEYGPYRQSERLDIYLKHSKDLINKGHAYYCFCTKERLEKLRSDLEAKKLPPMYDKKCLKLPKEETEKNIKSGMPYVIRLNVPNDRKIVVDDILAGRVEFDSNLIDDQVLIKSDGFPTYHLAVVVDDYLMKITHIFRGKEWLSSTPKHVLLYEDLGWLEQMPKFIHLPVILNTDGKGKLSKRHGHSSVEYYKKEGFLPEAILNYLSNIVWNHPGGKEIYPLEDLRLAFELEPLKVKVTSQAPRFDLAKLEWMNGEYIRGLSDEELTKSLKDYLGDLPGKDKLALLVPLIKERIKKLADFVPLTKFIFEEPEYDIKTFQKLNIKNQKDILENILEKMEGMEKPWRAEVFEQTFRKLANEEKISASQCFQLIRLAVSGQLVTPPLFESIQIIGEEKVIDRVKKVLNVLMMDDRR